MLVMAVISDVHLIRRQVTATDGVRILTDSELLDPIHSDAEFADVDIELRNALINFLPALKKLIGPIEVVLVGGDIAFHAYGNQYAAAANLLRDIQAELDGSIVLTVPGNHDVNRDQTRGPNQRYWRSRPRMDGLDEDERQSALVDLLSGAESGPGLLVPLSAYNRFAGVYGCDISIASPHWKRRLPINDRYSIEIRGLTSVLISDEHDDDDKLLLGDLQASDLAPSPGRLAMTICHHPYSWLRDGERQHMRLRQRCILHVTGHEHQHSIEVDTETQHVHLCLGALQPTRDQNWDPRVYGLTLDVLETAGTAEAKIRIVSARWSRGQDTFVVDSDETLGVPIPIAPPGASPDTEAATTFKSLVLVERIGALQSGDRLTAAVSIGAPLPDLVGTGGHDLPRKLVDWAQENGRLAALWDEMVRLHGGQMDSDNPFR